MAIACACCVHRGPQWRPGATGFQPGKHRWWMIWMCPTPKPPLNISKAEFGKVCFFVFEPTNRPETSVWLSQFRYFVFSTKQRIWDYSDRLGSQFAISCPCVVFIKASCNPVWNFGAWLKNCGNPLGQPKEGMRGGVAQLSTSFRSHLVGGWPTSLKNDGVNVSWDDDIPNWMEKSSGSSKPPTSQKKQDLEQKKSTHYPGSQGDEQMNHHKSQLFCWANHLLLLHCHPLLCADTVPECKNNGCKMAGIVATPPKQ